MQQEISREAFMELVVLELRKQGLTERASKAAQPEPESTLLGAAKWTAHRTFRALQFDQPRAHDSGLMALAIAMERKASTEESKDDASVQSQEEDEWLIVNKKFVEGVCSIVSSSPSPGASRLASALFVDCVYFILFSSSGSSQWLEVDCMEITQHLSGTILKDYRPQDVRTWTNRIADITIELERQGKQESWKKYVHLMRESVAMEASGTLRSTIEMARFETACQALIRCAPTTDVSLQCEFWDCISGLARDVRRNAGAVVAKLSERSLGLLPSIVDALNNNPDMRPRDAASALGVVDVILATNDPAFYKAIAGAGILRYASVAYSERKFDRQDVFLSNFLMRLAYKYEKACDFLLGLDKFVDRVLAANDHPTSTPSERAIWAIILASCGSASQTASEVAEVVALERLASLDRNNGNPFLRYLNDQILVSKIRKWKHAQKVIQTVEAMRPVKQPAIGDDGKEAVDDDFANLFALYKRTLSGLRGGSGGVD